MKKQYETIVITIHYLKVSDIITASGEGREKDGVPIATSSAFRGEDDVLETTA